MRDPKRTQHSKRYFKFGTQCSQVFMPLISLDACGRLTQEGPQNPCSDLFPHRVSLASHVNHWLIQSVLTQKSVLDSWLCCGWWQSQESEGEQSVFL